MKKYQCVPTLLGFLLFYSWDAAPWELVEQAVDLQPHHLLEKPSPSCDHTQSSSPQDILACSLHHCLGEGKTLANLFGNVSSLLVLLLLKAEEITQTLTLCY